MNSPAAPRPPAELRLLAVLVGIAALAACALVSVVLLLAGISNAEVPDPLVPDGDKCCVYPDTWADVLGGLFLTAAAGAVFVLGLVAIGAGLDWSAGKPWPSLRRWLTGPWWGGLVAVIAFIAALAWAAVSA